VREKFSATIEERGADTLIGRLHGDFYGSTEAYAFQDDVRDRIAAGRRKVVLDLSRSGKIDSSGVGILVALMWSCYQAKGAMVLASLPPTIEKVLGIAMLLERMTHAPSLDEALAKLDATTLPG
jgi:anti-anti-sigma factor